MAIGCHPSSAIASFAPRPTPRTSSLCPLGGCRYSSVTKLTYRSSAETNERPSAASLEDLRRKARSRQSQGAEALAPALFFTFCLEIPAHRLHGRGFERNALP